MDLQHPCKPVKISNTNSSNSEEVSSGEWEFINMTEQEEDLINRMYRLVGDRWDLIAGRIPRRKPEEIERFWIMRHCKVFAERRNRLTDMTKNKNSVEEGCRNRLMDMTEHSVEEECRFV